MLEYRQAPMRRARAARWRRRQPAFAIRIDDGRMHVTRATHRERVAESAGDAGNRGVDAPLCFRLAVGVTDRGEFPRCEQRPGPGAEILRAEIRSGVLADIRVDVGG